LDKRIGEINDAIPALTEKLHQIKPSLFNRLLLHNFSEELYLDAINLIQKIPSFWESPELLKNLGICCYGYTSKGNLTEKNYQTIISSWLTAVFSDKVIIKSLEETNWDDAYTFTLSESIGSKFFQHSNLPDNVNYDPVSETNISIGETQKELLNQYEAILISAVSDASLAKSINTFYIIEKDALEKIISVIENEIFFPAPYFARLYKINNHIIKELDSDYEKYSDEASLEAGIPYLRGTSVGLISDFATAKSTVDTIIQAINDEKIIELKKATTSILKSLVNKFDTIESQLEDSIYNAFAAKIEDDEENETLFSLMEECIRFSNQNEKLKYQYSNYLVNYTVEKVNSDNIDNYKALTIINKAYLYAMDNSRICKNFITLIRYNLLDILNDRTNKVIEIYNILDDFYLNRNETLRL